MPSGETANRVDPMTSNWRQPYGTFTHTLRCAAIVEIVVAALRCASDSVAIAQRCAIASSALRCAGVAIR